MPLIPGKPFRFLIPDAQEMKCFRIQAFKDLDLTTFSASFILDSSLTFMSELSSSFKYLEFTDYIVHFQIRRSLVVLTEFGQVAASLCFSFLTEVNLTLQVSCVDSCQVHTPWGTASGT